MLQRSNGPPAMSAVRTPAKHFMPLAIGAPEPYRQLPVRLERMVHFVPPHNEKIRARLAELIPQVDAVLGNLEDAIASRRQDGCAARLHRHGEGARLRTDRPVDAHQCAELALGARRHPGDRAGSRRQTRRDHAAQGRGALGHPLSRSAAGPARGQACPAQADPHSRHPGDGGGGQERGGHRRRQPAHARHEPGTRPISPHREA